MKIRQGFVSNSSSSSFLVCFTKMPQNVEELQKLLFGDQKVFQCDSSCHTLTTHQIARWVWDDMQKQTPLSMERAFEEVQWAVGDTEYKYELTPRIPFPWNCSEEEEEARETEYRQAARKRNDRIFKHFTENFQGPVYFFEYEDNESSGALMAHGGIFDNLPHVWVGRR